MSELLAKTIFLVTFIATILTVECQQLDDKRTLLIPDLSSSQQAQFYYQVSVRLFGYHLCGGAIISSNYVVTAASCADSALVSGYTIVAGPSRSNPSGTIVNVIEIKVHPNSSFTQDDIALLRLGQFLRFSEFVRPILLASAEPPVDAEVVVATWSYPITEGFNPTLLPNNTLIMKSRGWCQQFFGIKFSPSMLCFYHTRGSDICSEEIGRPAVYNGRLVGILSYRLENCNVDKPTAFSSIAHHYKWLRQNSDLNGPSSPPIPCGQSTIKVYT